MECKKLPRIVTIGWGTFEFKGQYSQRTYSYYQSDRQDPHFTVTGTGGGDGDFNKFHITTGSFNAHVWFASGSPAPDEPWNRDRNFGQNLPDNELGLFRDWVVNDWNEIKTAAREFYEYCLANPRPPMTKFTHK